jgi:lactoylglutathione lyase
VVRICRLFGVSVDWLLLYEGPMLSGRKRDKMRFGMYLIVKDFGKSVCFYEKLLDMGASTLGVNRFAQFFFDGICLSVMNEAHFLGHDYSGCGDHKFAFNFWVPDLNAAHVRIQGLDIGPVGEIIHANANYRFFNVIDPDRNVIEITGKYTSDEV